MLAALTGSSATAAGITPDNAVVSETIAALQAGDIKELEWLVSRVGVLQFMGTKLTQKADALKTLSGCKAKERARTTLQEFTYFEFEWKCAKNAFVGKLVLDQGRKSVALVDVLTKAEHKEFSRRFPYVMLPPIRIVSSTSPLQTPQADRVKGERRKAEMARMVDLAGMFAKAVAEGDMSVFSMRHSTASSITYGFFNPYLNEEFVDRIWIIQDGVAEAGKALADAVAYSRNQLGKPVSWACEAADPYVECTWRFENPSTSLKSSILVFRHDSNDWGIKVFWLRYETAEKLQEAKRRAAN